MRTFILFFIVLLSINCTSFAQKSSNDSLKLVLQQSSAIDPLDLITNSSNQEFVDEVIFNEFSDESGTPFKVIDPLKLQLAFCKRYYSTLHPSTKRWYNIYKK